MLNTADVFNSQVTANAMSANPDKLLKSKLVNGWYLFWLISLPNSFAVVLSMLRADLSDAQTVSSMIQLSVRIAVPYLYFAFAASALTVVWPGSFSRWLLRNRKIVGLCFALAMAWQLLFIVWLVTIHTDYYVDEVYVLTDVIEGVVGYGFLIAMVLTSFKFCRKHLTTVQWKRLHLSAIYWLWMYVWSTYWFELFYYEQPAVLLSYIYYWAGFLAWGLRLAAWSKKRLRQSGIWPNRAATGRLIVLVSGITFVVTGLAAGSFGAAWSPQVYAFLFSFKFIETIDTFSPYFPLVPFYPIFLLALGAFMIVKSTGQIREADH
jgi:hypothetical protein